MSDVVVVDYGAGNTRSVRAALAHLGASSVVSSDPARIADAELVVLPGVGSARSAMDHLDYNLARSSWIGDYNDPQTFLGMFTSNDGNNRTGWKSAAYDTLITGANEQTDLKKREQIFQSAETMLVSNQVPIVPLFFYVGINYFDTNKIQGIYENILDDHPLQCIRKVSPKSTAQGPN